MADDGTPESQDAFGRTPPPDDFATTYGSADDPASQPDPNTDPSGPDALAEALERLAEARQYVVHLAAAEIDRLKLKARRILMWAIVGVAALVIVLAILLSAVGMLLWGLVTLLVSLLGWPMWAGALTVGGGVLLLAISAIALDFWAWNLEGFARARRRYEARKQAQRQQFGRSVDLDEDQRGPDDSKT